ncbi:hypothetical protein WJX81_008629 [Elliptochloris bilobata]|uniref:Uncharacterized protein n=1 Tax=Elliptochloris bilobata TaxID=381761 RepID=A0AAW1RD46_9CHLO
MLLRTPRSAQVVLFSRWLPAPRHIQTSVSSGQGRRRGAICWWQQLLQQHIKGQHAPSTRSALQGVDRPLADVQEGDLLSANAKDDGAGSFVMRHAGWHPDSDDPAATPWLRRFPGFAAALRGMQKVPAYAALQAPASAAAGFQLAGQRVTGARIVYSLRQLRADAASDAGDYWCNGTGPADPEPSGLDAALLVVGELAALRAGRRDVVMTQLHVGWGGGAPRALQPALRPFVAAQLKALALDPRFGVVMSHAPGGLGLTAILRAAEPARFAARAAALAAFGAQAALVASSPFYQLLVGRVLGYREDNIRHHVQACGNVLTPAMERAVDAELERIDAGEPPAFNPSPNSESPGVGSPGSQPCGEDASQAAAESLLRVTGRQRRAAKRKGKAGRQGTSKGFG